MRAIRNMEPAWESERQGKFSLTQIREEIPNGGYRLRPVYMLTKTECLYVATKFNDVARARLVLRTFDILHSLQTKNVTLQIFAFFLRKPCGDFNTQNRTKNMAWARSPSTSRKADAGHVSHCTEFQFVTMPANTFRFSLSSSSHLSTSRARATSLNFVATYRHSVFVNE